MEQETERLTSRLRRQRSVSPSRELHALDDGPSSKTTKPNSTLSRIIPSGFGIGFLIPSIFKIKVQDKSDVSAKKKFQVNVPTRLLAILALVFLVIPVLIFLKKEAHIHERHDEAHFKPEKFVNVDTKDAMKHFLDHHHHNTSKTSASNDENEPTRRMA